MRAVYAPQARLSQLTEEQSRLSRLIVAIFVVEIAWSFSGLLPIAPLLTAGPAEGNSMLGMTLSLVGSGMIGVGVAIALPWLQERSWLTLLGSFDQFFRDFLAVLKWTGGIAIALQLLWVLPFAGEADHTRNPLIWLLALPIAALATLIQTGAEELYYRGMLQSTLAARFRSPLVWLLGPSLLFALGHVQADMSATESYQVMIHITIFGLIAGDLTARSGSLGAAMAFHFANNFTIFVLAGELGDFNSGLALWLFEMPDALAAEQAEGPVLSATLMIGLLIQAIYWLAARIAIRA